MTKPNFLIIYPDSMGMNSLGCYGNEFAKTPAIDQLAETGVKFTNCTSSNPVCQPSRASLHTGRYVSGHNVRNNSCGELSGDYPSIAQELKKADYSLAYYGKTHALNQDEWDDVFDLYPDYNRYLKGRGIDIKYPEKPSPSDLCAGQSEIPAKDFSENILGNLGDKYIRNMKDKDNPFCLFMSFEAPHSPWTIPSEYEDMFCNDDIPLLDIPEHDSLNKPSQRVEYLAKRASFATTDDKLKNAIRIYMTLLNIVDQNVKRLVQALDETGQRDNTVIIVLSDHGDHLGNHHSMGKSLSLDQSLIHVPLIFNYPSKWQNKISEALVQNIDIMPTILDMAGVDIPFGVQGKNLSDILAGKDETLRNYAFSEEHNDFYNGAFSIRDQRYKLVFSEDGFEELYDLKDDPYEWCNIALEPEYQAKVNELKTALLKWRFECLDRRIPQDGSWVKEFMKPGKNRY